MKNDLVVLLLGRIGAVIIALLSLRLATTTLPATEYGAWAILLSFQSFCGLFLINPVGQYINRHTHRWSSAGILVAKMIRYQRYVGVASLVGGVLYLFWGYLHSHSNSLFVTSIVLTIVVFAATWNATLIPMLNMLGERRSAVTLSLLSSVAGLACAYGFALYSPSGVHWFAGQAIGQALGAILAWKKLKSYYFPNCSQSLKIYSGELMTRATFVKFCIPLAISTGFMWVQLVGYRLGFEVLFGLEQLGLVAVGLGLANQIFALLETLAMQYIYPYFYQVISKSSDIDDHTQALSDLINLLLPLYILLAICATVTAPAMLQLLTHNQYHGSYYFVMIGFSIELCRVASNVFGLAAQVTQKTNTVIIPYAAGVLVLFSITAAVHKFNGNALLFVVGLCFSWLVSTIYMYFSMRREVSFTVDRLSSLGLAVLFVVVEIVCGLFTPVVTSVHDALILSVGSGSIFMLFATILVLRQAGSNRLLKIRFPAMQRSS